MVRVLRIFVVITLLLAVATPALAKGPGQLVPIKGTVVGEHGPPNFTAPDCPDWAFWRYSSEGEGRMSHLGRVEYHLTQCTAPGPDGFESVGTLEFTAANGDELWLRHTMVSQGVWGPDPGPPLGFTFEGEWEAVGGTGRFTHATGSGDLYGAGDSSDGVPMFDDIPEGLMQINLEGDIAYKRK